MNSCFRLTYNMLLNLRRFDLEQVSAVIDKSFYKYMVDFQAKKFTTKEKELEDTIARRFSPPKTNFSFSKKSKKKK